MHNRLMSLALALTLVAGLATLGCSSKPPENVKKATVTDAQPMPDKAPAPEAPSETTPDAATTAPAPPAAAAGAKNYTISLDDSYLMWIGYGGVLGSMEGGFSEFGGSVEAAGTDPETAAITVTVNMDSVFSDAKMLTNKLHGEHYFEIEKFPEAIFTSTSVKKDGDAYTVTGNLSLHGEVKSIAFPANIAIDGDTLTADAEFTFDRHAWGVDYEETGDNFIKDDVLLKFEVVAKS